ncbi:methionine ABC transporter ATP-binding protein [Hydrogenophaga atypica]|uniref:Methionine ABC transporter ATP-binding protein n=1 Tax=Hydrogenophaga atypica TaxID=249409 RepID=A0ABW2QID2_9BURK
MIEFCGVQKTYTTGNASITALQRIDLKVNEGEIFGVIGHSGAGKSTLIRLINLLERPTEGTVKVSGVDLMALSENDLRQFRQHVGMIFQHFNLLGSMTVAENIAYAMRIVGQKSAQAIDARVDELLELVGLSKHKHKYPRQLSGGEKQRVGIARALSNHPTVLLCDEATSALDPQTTHSILQLLRRINETLKLTIVLITHEMDVIRTVCDRVAVIDGGRIVEEGAVTQVFLHPQHPTTKRFVQEAEGAHDAVVWGDNAAPRGGLYRLTFQRETVHQPLLSRVARSFAVDFSIITGRFGAIKSEPCGQVVVRATGEADQVQGALSQLAQAGVCVEEVSDATVA